MYSFLRDGEFVQFTVEDQGHVIGFVSRYADAEGAGGFVDHFFKSATLDGNKLAFTTEVVQGVSFNFRGAIKRGEAKTRADEGYFVLTGTLIENTIDAAKKADLLYEIVQHQGRNARQNNVTLEAAEGQL